MRMRGVLTKQEAIPKRLYILSEKKWHKDPVKTALIWLLGTKNNSKQALAASQKDCPLASKLSKIDRGKLFGSMTICIEGDGACAMTRSDTGIHCGNYLSPQITSMLIGKHGLGPFWPLPSLPWTDSVGTVPERNSRGKFSGHLKSSSYCKLNFDATYLLWTVIPKGFQGPALQSENIPKIVQNFFL